MTPEPGEGQSLAAGEGPSRLLTFPAASLLLALPLSPSSCPHCPPLPHGAYMPPGVTASCSLPGFWPLPNPAVPTPSPLPWEDSPQSCTKGPRWSEGLPLSALVHLGFPSVTPEPHWSWPRAVTPSQGPARPRGAGGDLRLTSSWVLKPHQSWRSTGGRYRGRGTPILKWRQGTRARAGEREGERRREG